MKRPNPRGIPQEVIDHRRAQVSRLALSGLNPSEITRALASDTGGLRNPDTGESYGRTTIVRDLAYLRKGWREQASQAVEEHQARILAELREIGRRAASGKEPDLFAWLKALAQQAKLVGADAPARQDIEVRGDGVNADLARRLLGIAVAVAPTAPSGDGADGAPSLDAGPSAG